MTLLNFICERLTKFEEQLIQAFEHKFAMFESKMLILVENKVSSGGFQQQVSVENLL